MLCACGQACHAVAVALEQNGTARSTASNVLRALPPSTTEPHRISMQKPGKDCGVNPALLQGQTGSMVSPTSSLEHGSSLWPTTLQSATLCKPTCFTSCVA